MSLPSHCTLKLMGGNTYQPKADADVAGSQYRNARVGREPAADRSARMGYRAVGMKR